MTKSIWLLALALILTPVPEHGSAAQNRNLGGTYLRVNGGLVTSMDSTGPDEDIDFDEGYLVSGAIGQRMLSPRYPLNFDLEIEGLWSSLEARDEAPIVALDDVGLAGAFLNGTFDLRLGGRLSAYAGAGIGGAWMDLDTQRDALYDFVDEDGPFLAWQAKAGLSWRLSRRSALSVGYRYLAVEDIEIEEGVSGANFDLETEQHAIEFGFRWGI